MNRMVSVAEASRHHTRSARHKRTANLRAQSVRTRWPDLYQVGDETFPGQGTVACALSGFNAWREIVGK